ncbi:hypothetical protein Bbelb_371270 [Branchiostoma belcheri]|nr:hypothetical protein Bbelb_371270 [Branchiostoma belcheri]
MPDGSGRAGSDGVPSLISGTAVRGKFVDAANCVGTVRTPFPAKDGQGRRPVGVSPLGTLSFLQRGLLSLAEGKEKRIELSTWLSGWSCHTVHIATASRRTPPPNSTP